MDGVTITNLPFDATNLHIIKIFCRIQTSHSTLKQPWKERLKLHNDTFEHYWPLTGKDEF